MGNVEDEDVRMIIDVKFRKYNGKKRKRAVVKWNMPLEESRWQSHIHERILCIRLETTATAALTV